MPGLTPVTPGPRRGSVRGGHPAHRRRRARRPRARVHRRGCAVACSRSARATARTSGRSTRTSRGRGSSPTRSVARSSRRGRANGGTRPTPLDATAEHDPAARPLGRRGRGHLRALLGDGPGGRARRGASRARAGRTGRLRRPRRAPPRTLKRVRPGRRDAHLEAGLPRMPLGPRHRARRSSTAGFVGGDVRRLRVRSMPFGPVPMLLFDGRRAFGGRVAQRSRPGWGSVRRRGAYSTAGGGGAAAAGAARAAHVVEHRAGEHRRLRRPPPAS